MDLAPPPADTLDGGRLRDHPAAQPHARAEVMSLTGQLATGELGRWCAATLTGTTDMAAHVATRVQGAVAAGAHPVRPRRVDDPGHWAAIGGALGQRLAFAIHHAPPYYALLGAHRAGLTDPDGVHRAAAAFPTHAELDAARAARANQLRPLPGGRWLDLGAVDHTVDHAAATPDHGAGDLVGNLVARLVAYLAEHVPPGQLAHSRGAEAVLARACLVLTDWETAYRTGQLADQTLARYADPGLTVDALLAAAPDHQVDELVDLATRAHHAGLLARLAPAPPAAGGIAGPVFVPHWADGDLLLPTADPPPTDPSVDGDGATVLLDVKTVMSVRDPARVGRWLWQLLGYAWLDPTDRYRIRAAGLYLARHGLLLTWPLPDLAAALLSPGHPAGRCDVDAAAEQFRRLAGHVITNETGHPPALARTPRS